MLSSEDETKFQHLSLQIQHLRAMDTIAGRNESLPIEELDIWSGLERAEKRKLQYQRIGRQALKSFPVLIMSYMKSNHLTDLFIGVTDKKINFDNYPVLEISDEYIAGLAVRAAAQFIDQVAAAGSMPSPRIRLPAAPPKEDTK